MSRMASMKICQVCPYTPPAKDSMGSERIIERVTKGLLELGHEVVMKVNQPSEPFNLAPIVSDVPKDCDILHFHGWDPFASKNEYDSYGIPYVITMHGGGMETDARWMESVSRNPNIICVSKFISDRLKCPAYVWSCADPQEFKFNSQKGDYFLWMAGTDWGEGKGLFSTIAMAKKLRFRLKIAGTGKNKEIINQIKSLCDNKIEYVGALNGKEKAEALAFAKALILLTKLPDACPATVSEALISGTPVIGSNFGSMPELITDKTGFVCKNDSEFARAINSIQKINPYDCVKYALENFNYTVAAEKYLQYYNNVIKYGNVQGEQ